MHDIEKLARGQLKRVRSCAVRQVGSWRAQISDPPPPREPLVFEQAQVYRKTLWRVDLR